MLPDLSDSGWRKSSHSGGEGTECVELHPDGAIRDSKNPDAVLAVQWAGLVAVAKQQRK